MADSKLLRLWELEEKYVSSSEPLFELAAKQEANGLPVVDYETVESFAKENNWHKKRRLFLQKVLRDLFEELVKARAGKDLAKTKELEDRFNIYTAAKEQASLLERGEPLVPRAIKDKVIENFASSSEKPLEEVAKLKKYKKKITETIKEELKAVEVVETNEKTPEIISSKMRGLIDENESVTRAIHLLGARQVQIVGQQALKRIGPDGVETAMDAARLMELGIRLERQIRNENGAELRLEDVFNLIGVIMNIIREEVNNEDTRKIIASRVSQALGGNETYIRPAGPRTN
jgi:hypothetical protein